VISSILTSDFRISICAFIKVARLLFKQRSVMAVEAAPTPENSVRPRPTKAVGGKNNIPNPTAPIPEVTLLVILMEIH
jgi:hypothetical protein